MAVILSPFAGAGAQFFNNDGVILAGGLIYTYAAGTNTPAPTYTSSSGAIPHTNPIVLDSAGRVPGGEIWLTDGDYYKFVLNDSNNALVATYDDILGINASITAADVSFTGFKGQTGNVEDLAGNDGSDWIGFTQAGNDAIPISAQDKMRQIVSVKDFGATGDGTTNDTVAIAAAISATPANGSLYFPAGTYCANIFVWRSNISLIGSGSASTIIKLPNNCPSVTVPVDGGGTVTGLPNVIEIGECAMGNSAPAYTNVVVRGMTIDGNYSNNTAPTSDLFGHGMILTNTSNCFVDDVISKNCFVTGIANVINSNYNKITATCINCGQAAISGTHYPNFDVNSSKQSFFNVISVDGYYGARLLDNCWGNNFAASITNPSITGFVYNNQTTNSSYNNIINVTVKGNCVNGQGVSVGANCYDSDITASVYGVLDVGILIGANIAGTEVAGNTIIANTSNCGGIGFTDTMYAKFNNYIINSRMDGRTGTPGTSFAVFINGVNNTASVTVQEGNTSQVRGLFLSATSMQNQIASLMIDPNTVQILNDLGTNNSTNYGQGIPPDIASANDITLTFYGSFFKITGTTQIDNINYVASMLGRIVTLIFDDALTVSSSVGNIKLSGGADFVTSANDTLTLASNGTYWYEVARSVN